MFSNKRHSVNKSYSNLEDRKLWCDMLSKMALPVLTNMSKGTLHQNMEIETGPLWDHRDVNLGYIECFGRLMAGMAPWLSLPPDNSPEGEQRQLMLDMALEGYKNAVDPLSPDYLKWEGHPHFLVDAAYFAESFIKGFDTIWCKLDETTRSRYIEKFIHLRTILPYYNNWLLFSAVIETFINKATGNGDKYRIIQALRKIEEWYVGDGWYSDGPDFAFDYYNSFVIQPMYVECLMELESQGWGKAVLTKGLTIQKAIKRLQRFGCITERLISPEGMFPVVGRSITYRSAVLHSLSYLTYIDNLPDSLSYGQVRSAMTAVLANFFCGSQNYNSKGFLQLGFNGHQVDVADRYTNSGSLYIASLAFLPLGLPESHSFWTLPNEDWTSKKAWGGMHFSIDRAYKVKPISLKQRIKEKLIKKVKDGLTF